MPFGIPGGVLDWPGSPYSGQPVQTVLLGLNRGAQSSDPAVKAKAVADFKAMSALPQFHGIGWQGLLSMAAIMGGGALVSAFTGGASAGAGAAAGTTSSGQLTAGTVVPGTFGSIGGSVAGTAGGIAGTGLTAAQLAQIGLSGLGGALEQTQGARTSTQTPFVTPEYQGLADLLRTRAMDRLNASGDIAGLTANGISGINDAYKGITQSIGNSLTNRGLANSPVAGTATTNTNLARAGDITQFLNNLPLLQSQLQNQDINTAANVLTFGRGQTGVAPGSALAGGLTSAAEMLAYLRGRGATSGVGGNINLGGGYGGGAAGGGVYQ